MKCIINSTGEIVDVVSWSASGLYTDYIDSAGNAVTSKLDYNKDFDFIDNELTSEIDWEQRRYELAKASMQGLLSNPDVVGLDVIIDSIAFADKMIAQLKQTNETK